MKKMREIKKMRSNILLILDFKLPGRIS